MTEDEYKAAVADSIMQLGHMHATNDIKAIAVVAIRGNGDIRTMLHHDDDTKFPMLAGTAILHDAALRMCKHSDPPRDIVGNG